MRLTPVALAVCLACTLLGCPGVQHACTEIGCYDFFEVELVGPWGSPVGDFSVTAVYGPDLYDQTCEADHLVTHGGFDCGDETPWRVAEWIEDCEGCDSSCAPDFY